MYLYVCKNMLATEIMQYFNIDLDSNLMAKKTKVHKNVLLENFHYD